MENNKEIETINVGLFGHIDHGKTTLLYKLSGRWADTHSEEMKRGITIKLGYASITIYSENGKYNKEKGIPQKYVTFVDAPGHEMLMSTALSGAAMCDVAILVIAANEGIKPQTREHLMAIQAKKVENLIVVQNKIDLVTKEQAKKNYEEIKEFLKNSYKDVPIIPISSQQEVNIEYLYQALAEIPEIKREKDCAPFFVVARSFDINKPGTTPEKLCGAVLGGVLKKGTLKVGDKIEIKPGRIIKEANQYKYQTLKTRIVSLYKGNKKVQELTPGGSASIETEMDMSLGKNDALAGNFVSLEGALPEKVNELSLKYLLFKNTYGQEGAIGIENIKPSELLMLSIETSLISGVVKKISGDKIDLNLKIPAIIFKGQNIAIARNIKGHWRLIGFGEIL